MPLYLYTKNTKTCSPELGVWNVKCIIAQMARSGFPEEQDKAKQMLAEFEEKGETESPNYRLFIADK